MIHDVAIVGAGPAGLSAAAALARRGLHVVVLDREPEGGGVPRHTAHLGYGMRDMHRLMSGPTYARRLRERADGAEIRTSTTAIGWTAESGLQVVDERGSSILAARAIILATGVRERPRSARLVPGDRPAGVFTTGTIQQLTALHHQPPGRRAVILGAEHVSFSAVLTLGHAGCDVAAIVTPHPRHQTYAALRWATARRIPVITGDDVTAIHGHRRVEAVTLASGRRIECDTVVFTGDWIPDHELARHGGLTIDPAHKGAVVDQAWRTTRQGVFAIGNLVHPAETAGRCADDGFSCVEPVRHWLEHGSWPAAPLPINAAAPLLWVSPSRWCPDVRMAPDRLLLRVVTGTVGVLQVWQGATRLWTGRRRTYLPNRSYSIRGAVIGAADPTGEPLVVRLQQ